MYTISEFEFDNSSNNNTTTNTTTIMDNPEVGINDLFKDAKEAWDRYQKQELNPQREEKASSSASSNIQPQQPLFGSMLNPLGGAQAQPYAAALAASSINNPVAAAAAAGAASRRSGDAPSQKRVSESSSASASNGQEPQAKSESKAPPPPPPPHRPLTKEEQANSVLAMLLGKNNNSPTPDPPFPTSLTDSDNISQAERRRREEIEESIKLKYYQTMNPTRELVWDEPTFTLDKDASANKKTSSSSSKKRKSPQPTYSFKRIANVYNQTHCGRAVIYTTCRSALPRPSSDSNYYESAGMVDGLLVSSPKKLKPSLSTTKNDKDWTKEEADTMMDFANQYTQKKKKKKTTTT